MLNKDIPVSIHHRKLQVLATEIFKIRRSLFPDNLRKHVCPKKVRIIFVGIIRLKDAKFKSYHSTELLSFPGSKIWDLVQFFLFHLFIVDEKTISHINLQLK